MLLIMYFVMYVYAPEVLSDEDDKGHEDSEEKDKERTLKRKCLEIC